MFWLRVWQRLSTSDSADFKVSSVMFTTFEIPATIERDLVDFFQQQQAFPLTRINPRAPADDPYKAELSRHYGVYVLYYRGPFPLYADLADQNRDEPRQPIYIGKAVSLGSRTGGKREASLLDSATPGDTQEVNLELALETLNADARVPQSNSLFKRLGEHAASIRKADDTLRVEDFEVRVIPMADALVQWAEAVMIKRLRPIWNAQISGFGNHDPGKGRYQQARSIWDQLHPGRSWATRMENLAPYDTEQLKRQIRLTLDTDLDDQI